MFIICVIDLSTENKMNGGSYFYENQKYRPLEIEKKKIVLVISFQKLLIFHIFQKMLNFRRSIALSLQKISRKRSLMGFLIGNLQTCKLQLSALRVFKDPEITHTVEFPSSEAGTKQQLKPPRPTSVLEKDFPIAVSLYNKLQKAKINTSKDKINFLKMPTPTSMPTLIFRYKNSGTEN